MKILVMMKNGEERTGRKRVRRNASLIVATQLAT
jgi:hypothetical protein